MGALPPPIQGSVRGFSSPSCKKKSSLQPGKIPVSAPGKLYEKYYGAIWLDIIFTTVLNLSIQNIKFKTGMNFERQVNALL